MIATKQFPLCAIILTASLLGIGWGHSAVVAQQRVGVSSAVNPEATGISPGAPPRRLVLGQEIVFNEQITTAGTGQTQILFLDGSAMTIGPDSFMVIDQFAYDPNSGGGTLKMNLERGQFRFVGGKLSKQDSSVTMKTPSGVIEVRGGVILVDLSPNGKLDVIFAYGRGVTVTGLNGISQTIMRPGFQITLSGRGAAPSTPSPAPLGASATILARLDGQRGRTGGAATVPTDSTVANSSTTGVIVSNVSAQGAETAAAQGSTAAGQTTSAQGSTAAGQITSAAVSGPVQQNQTTIQLTANQPTMSSASPSTQPTMSRANPSTYAGIFKRTTNGNGSIVGFTGQSPPARIPYTDGTLANGVFTSALGGAGTLRIPLAPGTASFGPNGTASPLGPVNGTSYLSADGTFFYANLTPVNAPMQREFVAGGMPVMASALASAPIVAFTVQPDAALQSNIPFIPANAGGNLANAYVSPLFIAPQTTTALQSSLAINGQGANQQSVLITAIGSATPNASQPAISGVVRGSSQLSAAAPPVRIGSNLSSVPDGNGNSLYGSSAISGFVLDQTQASLASEVPLSGTTTNYGFNQPATATSLPAGVGSTARTTQTQTGYFGGVMNTTVQAQPYAITGTTMLSTDAAANSVAASFTTDQPVVSATGAPSQIQFGGAAGNSAFINDSIYGAAESQPQSSQLYLVSQGAAPPPNSLLPAAASYCSCQYLQWGYWGGDISSSPGGVSRIDRGGINLWVAGQITPIADINMLAAQGATGNFSGHLIGSVYNNGAQYVAAGGLNATYNFGTRAASFSVTNYDNLNFTTKGTPVTSGATYKFSISDVSNLSGAINGSFYGPLAAETGGNFTFSKIGAPYLTSGIFAAVKH